MSDATPASRGGRRWAGLLYGGLLALLAGCAGQQLKPGEQRFHINHIGYDRLAPKRAVLEANGTYTTFQVVDVQSQATAFEGALTAVPDFGEWSGGPMFYVADFSELDAAGNYALHSGGAPSEPFAVQDQLLFGTTIRAVLQYFRAMRASESDVALWDADAAVPIYGRSGTRDVRGGWYDASGDVSKYLTHLSYANFLNPQQTPLVVWALGWVLDTAPALLDTRGLRRDVQAEALWGADFLVRMQDETGFFYASVFDSWSGKASERKLAAFSGPNGQVNANYRAAFREGGGLAIAALARAAHWKQDSPSFSASRYLDAAERGFQHLLAHNQEYVDDGQENVIDDYAALLAASELYATAAKAQYLDAARGRAQQLVGRLHPSGYFIADGKSRPFWHASDAGLPVVALVRYLEIEPDSEQKAAASAAIGRHLDHLLAISAAVPNPYGYARQQVGTDSAAFFIPHDNESRYWWQGENARLASLSAAALLGGAVARPTPGQRLGVSHELASFALDQLDWVLGKNPFDTCMLAGFGRNNPAPYSNSKPESGTVVGGIANGITSDERSGTGIQWDKPTAGQNAWQRWRWIEQWLPHDAWYLIAITALTNAEGGGPPPPTAPLARPAKTKTPAKPPSPAKPKTSAKPTETPPVSDAGNLGL
ncbi:MAG TPA: glycoside hydrolase family 9 protein [Polyangiaceae bacterium]|nr:glycoside hydrolase family 9 protein [Polyangiaceae bacterium]